MEADKTPERFDPSESPIAWFGELVIAADRGDFDRAAQSKRELERLGWRVNRRKADPAPRRPRKGVAR